MSYRTKRFPKPDPIVLLAVIVGLAVVLTVI